MAKLRILYINFYLTRSAHGGINSHAIGIIEAFQQLGNEIIICSYCRIPHWNNRNVQYYLLKNDKTSTSKIKLVRMIKELIGQRREVKQIIDIINKEHVNLIYIRWPRNIFIKKIRNVVPNIPIVFECSTPLEMTGEIQSHGMFTKKIYHLIDKRNLDSATLVSAVSTDVKMFLLSRHPSINKEKIIVNPNGVDPTRFQYIDKNNIRKKYKIPSKAVAIGFAGAMYRWQGVDLLIEAFENISQKDIYLMIIGKCLDNNMEKKIMQLLESTDPSRLIMTGSAKFKDMPKYFSACDILVTPTVESHNKKFHGSPTKLFEYMAMGKGIVASRIGQIEGILKHNHNAILVESGDVNQLVEGILKLTENKKLRERLGKKAREEVISNYTWKKNIEKVIKTLEDKTTG